MSEETRERTVAELARHVGGRVVGDETVLIRRIASLESAGAEKLIIESGAIVSAVNSVFVSTGPAAGIETAELLSGAGNTRARDV